MKATAAIKRFLPLMDRVLVQKAKAEMQTKAGIFIPESEKAMLNEAKVIAIGQGRLNREGQTIPMSVAPGDTVVIPEYGGMAIKLDGEEFLVFRDEDIIAKFNESQQ